MNPPKKKCDSCGDALQPDNWFPIVSGVKIFYFCRPCASKYHQVVTALEGEENEL